MVLFWGVVCCGVSCDMGNLDCFVLFLSGWIIMDGFLL